MHPFVVTGPPDRIAPLPYRTIDPDVYAASSYVATGNFLAWVANFLRTRRGIHATPPAALIQRLSSLTPDEQLRVAWELVNYNPHDVIGNYSRR